MGPVPKSEPGTRLRGWVGLPGTRSLRIQPKTELGLYYMSYGTTHVGYAGPQLHDGKTQGRIKLMGGPGQTFYGRPPIFQ